METEIRGKDIKKAVVPTATVYGAKLSAPRGCVPDRSPADSPTPSTDFIRLAAINLFLHVDSANVKQRTPKTVKEKKISTHIQRQKY